MPRDNAHLPTTAAEPARLAESRGRSAGPLTDAGEPTVAEGKLGREIAGLEIELAHTEAKLASANAHGESREATTLRYHCRRIRERIQLVHSIRATLNR